MVRFLLLMVVTAILAGSLGCTSEPEPPPRDPKGPSKRFPSPPPDKK
ncbi:MAG: hypothetical protein HYR84_14430 [Planctomycetes bacterium]|nr:hypothetical protein [Planctomycetota bacterium]